jgi:hypothetical protein
VTAPSPFTLPPFHLATALLDTETDPEKKWQRLCEIHRELSRLRRDDDWAARTLIQQERWQHEYNREEAKETERQKAEAKQKLLDQITGVAMVPVNRDLFGGGKQGQELAELLYRVQHDMPYDDLLEPKKPETPSPATSTETDSPPPAEAPQVHPDESSHFSGAGVSPACTNTPANPGESSLIQPDPTKNDESLPETIDLPLAG